MKTTKNLNLILPSYNVKTQKYTWPLLKVNKTKTKGLGLFAKTSIPAGTCFPYFGQIYNEIQYIDLVKKNSNVMNRWHYLIENNDIYIDAHPKGDRKNLYLLGTINEPDPNETSNCWFLNIRDIPFVVVLVFENLGPGEELLIYYGSEFKRNYMIGNITLPSFDFPIKNGIINKTIVNKIKIFEKKIRSKK